VQRSGYRTAELEVANMSGWQHMKEAGICLYSFKFPEAFIEVVWALSRLCKIGDYGKDGYFTKLIEREKWNNYE
jgi:hypothetical protein